MSDTVYCNLCGMGVENNTADQWKHISWHDEISEMLGEPECESFYFGHGKPRGPITDVKIEI